jgi:hypothetical protein
LTGEPFLGAFGVAQEVRGCVVYLNYEVSESTFAWWLRDMGVPQDSLVGVHLRGMHNPLMDEAGRERLAAQLRKLGCEVLIVDPFGRAYTGRSQNDATEVTQFLVKLDEVAEQGGAQELVVAAHTGWNGERSRGSTALEDWPDSIITLTRRGNDENGRDHGDGARFFSAEGRDVSHPEDMLAFDPTTRLLRLTRQGSRRATEQLARLDALTLKVVEIVTAQPGINVTQLRQELTAQGAGGGGSEKTEAIVRAEVQGLIKVRATGPNGRTRPHYPANWTEV